MGGVCHPKPGLTTPKTWRHGPLQSTGLQHPAETAEQGDEQPLVIGRPELYGRKEDARAVAHHSLAGYEDRTKPLLNRPNNECIRLGPGG